MKVSPRFKTALAVCIGLAFLVFFASAAGAAEIKVLSVNGVKQVFGDLAAAFQNTTGHKVTVELGEAGVIRKYIEDGETFEVCILPRPATDQLIKTGKIISGSAVNIIRGPFGMGVRSGASKPDTSSVDAFKRSLLAAKLIVYTDPATGGASGVFFARLLESLGIAHEVRSKLTSGVLNGTFVAQGEADIAVQMKHELLAAPGIEFVPLPAEYSGGVVFAAAISANAKETDAAKSFIQFSSGPIALPLIKAKGMEPG
jgi:molybdate transport system substrate-binding protein